MQPVKVLLVDDSLFIRTSLKKNLNVPEIEIIDTASNGKEAVEKNLALNPDIIILDIEMPIMNGLEALEKIMETNPCPVLMFSSLTQEGAEATTKALELGALDFIPKQSSYFDVSSTREELIKKIVSLGSNKFLRTNLKVKYQKTTSQSKPVTQILTTEKAKSVMPKYLGHKHRPKYEDIKIVCIGISTGGPVALQEIVPQINPNFPVPIVVVQHMPPHFTESLANRLNQNSQINVVEGQDGDILKPGTIYLAKGGMQMKVTRQHTLQIDNNPTNELFKPSVNVLVNSIVDVYNSKAVGIIMTGMGNDGMLGLSNLHNIGGYVIAQEPISCVVAGMPSAVIDANMADEVQPLHLIAGTINSLFINKIK